MRTVTTQSDQQCKYTQIEKNATLIPIAGVRKKVDENGNAVEWVGFYVGCIILFAGAPQQKRVVNEVQRGYSRLVEMSSNDERDNAQSRRTNDKACVRSGKSGYKVNSFSCRSSLRPTNTSCDYSWWYDLLASMG